MSGVALKPAELEVALEEVRAVRAAARDEGHRGQLAALAAELEEQEVSDELLPVLERIVDLGLQSGRIRSVYGPSGEQAALRLHRRLPAGAESQASAREVSEALGALRGRVLEEVSIAVNGPGAFTLSLAADGLELTVRLDRNGARLSSVGA